MTPSNEIDWLNGMIRCWRGEIARRRNDHHDVQYDLARIVCQLELRKEQIEQATNIIRLPTETALPALWETV
jgi:hypothetical protein